jgi:SAM-dependent methyltransferase
VHLADADRFTGRLHAFADFLRPCPVMSTVDWSIGRYEVIAAQLDPAARVLVEYAAPEPGERVVDVGCGTGNAALLAAERGARVTGVDPAPRLLEVARGVAAGRGLDATFVVGDAAAVPLADGEADVVLSAFGVIFAPDPRAAAAEMARVTAGRGRIVLSAWNPSGAVHRAVRVAGEAVRNALGAPAGPPPFPWHEPEALAELFAPYGFEVAVEEERLAFTAPSPAAYIDQQADHPLAVAGRAVLGPRGESEALRARMLAIYETANEDPDAFRVTSTYVVATARRA